MAILTGDTILPGDPAMGLAGRYSGRAGYALRRKQTKEYLARPEVISAKKSCEQSGGHFKVKVNEDGSIKSGCKYTAGPPAPDFSGRAGYARKRKAEQAYRKTPEAQARRAECEQSGGQFYVNTHPNGTIVAGCRHSRERMIEILYAEAKTGGAKSLAKYEQMKREFLANPALMSAVGLDASIFAEVDALLLKMKSNANKPTCPEGTEPVSYQGRLRNMKPQCMPLATSPGGEASMPDWHVPDPDCDGPCEDVPTPPYETRKEAKQEHLWIWGAMWALALFVVLRKK